MLIVGGKCGLLVPCCVPFPGKWFYGGAFDEKVPSNCCCPQGVREGGGVLGVCFPGLWSAHTHHKGMPAVWKWLGADFLSAPCPPASPSLSSQAGLGKSHQINLGILHNFSLCSLPCMGPLPLAYSPVREASHSAKAYPWLTFMP